jgi:hypothetical protein
MIRLISSCPQLQRLTIGCSTGCGAPFSKLKTSPEVELSVPATLSDVGVAAFAPWLTHILHWFNNATPPLSPRSLTLAATYYPGSYTDFNDYLSFPSCGSIHHLKVESGVGRRFFPLCISVPSHINYKFCPLTFLGSQTCVHFILYDDVMSSPCFNIMADTISTLPSCRDL